jgi:tetratricopeptide (TPR) repeat protein
MTEEELAKEAEYAFDMGDLLVEQGKLEAALAVFETGLSLHHSLTSEKPTCAGYWRGFSLCFMRVGDVLLQQSKPEEALAAFEKGRKLIARLASIDPTDIDWQSDLAFSHANVGKALSAMGREGEALVALEQGIAVRKQIAAANPENWQLQRDLMTSCVNRALKGGDVAEFFEIAAEVAKTMAAHGELGPAEQDLPEILERHAQSTKLALQPDKHSHA